MIVDSYTICKQIADSLKPVVLAGNEINEVQIYSNTHFGGNCKIYNQIDQQRREYPKPYITINEIGQNEKFMQSIQIDIEFAIPVNEIKEVETDGVVEYSEYFRLSEFANAILKRFETKSNVCYSSSQIVFRPDGINTGKNEFSGSINVTYEFLTPISKR